MTQSKKSSVSKAKPKTVAKTATKTQKTALVVEPQHIAPVLSAVVAKKPVVSVEEETYAKEYWTGDSRDGALVNGDGYHFYRMTKSGKILEAYEFYETEDGREFASPLPEMLNVHWLNDLGFEDFEALDTIREFDFQRIKEISANPTGE